MKGRLDRNRREVQSRILSDFVGKSRWDRERDEKVTDSCDVTEITERISKRREKKTSKNRK